MAVSLKRPLSRPRPKPLAQKTLTRKPPVKPAARSLATTVAPAAIAASTPKPRPTAQQYIQQGIAGDWRVIGAEQAKAAGLGQQRASFQSALRQALVNLGVTDPNALGSLGSFIDADTIRQAAANKYSTTAQIGQAEARNRAQTEAALAARGILSSGQTTKSTQEIVADAEQARFNALQQFLGFGGEGLSELAGAEAGYNQDIAQAQGEAAQFLAGQYDLEFPAPPPATTFRQGQGGRYLTRAEFKKRRPKGDYNAYLAFLRRKRGGVL